MEIQCVCECVCVGACVSVWAGMSECTYMCMHIYMEARGQSTEVYLRSLSSEISHLALRGRLITVLNFAMCARFADYWTPGICQSLPCQSH